MSFVFEQGNQDDTVTIVVQTLLRRLQNLQHSKSFCPIRSWRLSPSATIEKVLAFSTQRFGFRNHNCFSFGVAGNWNLAVGPLDGLAIDQQLLVPGSGVVKHRDTVRANQG